MSAPLLSLLERPFRPRILLVGDVMLDRYLWGDVERISPEAPIPILRVSRKEHRLGGAGSVATMLVALETDPLLAAVVGDDPEGRQVRELLREKGVNCCCLATDPTRVTTLKERLLGRAQQRHPHHMMRVDREDDAPIADALRDELLQSIEAQLAHADLVLISDYNKGVCAGQMIPRIIELARQAGIPVLADPIKGADYRRYRGCTCITPNRLEAGLAAGMKIVTPQDGLAAARRLLDFGIETVLVTLDRDGIAWADQAGNARHFPCRPRQVCDITGAGDMVLSTLGYCLAAGADFPTAIELANVAGGLEVERLGVVPLTRQELAAELAHSGGAANAKILPLEPLVAELARQRQAGRRIAMTNGCYDLLHPGHVASLQAARKQGDLLVVGVNSDRSVREIKGPERPLIDEQGRAAMLAALACVDYVVIFDEASVAPLVERIRPDVLVKASQYTVEEVVGHEIVAGYGGQIACVPMKSGYSTTGLIERIRSLLGWRRHAA
jgi:D-beta-D-heptose 7-phosphate kinase/D-beta-D-heptose 1-phosphate adenosyltransferase